MHRPTLILTALSLLLGLQAYRQVLPSLTWYWGATRGLQAGLLVVAALTPVTLAWLAPFLAKRVGLSRTLWAMGGGLVLCRVMGQFAVTAAAESLLALAATASFMGLLPLLYLSDRVGDEAGLPSFTFGLLLGLSLDTALRGLTGTLDLQWVPGTVPRLVILGLAAVLVLALWRVTAAPGRITGGGLRAALPLIALGLLLFVDQLILQNQGWVTTLTGWPPALALAWITLGNVGALLAAAGTMAQSRVRSMRGWASLWGGGLILGLLAALMPGWIFALGALLALISTGALLAIVVGAAQPAGTRVGVAPLSFAFGVGLFLFVGLSILYYLSLLLPLLPFPRAWLAPLAGTGVGACALAAAWQPRSRAVRAAVWAPARLGAALLLAPMALWRADVMVEPPVRPGTASVRVMTYNIRAAIGLSGRLDVEAVARVIEADGAQVIAFQELSRGWLISGTADLLPLLSRRLSMPAAIFGPATDPLGGNAIVGRYSLPVGGYGDLPHLDALVGRGYVWAQIDLDGGEPLTIVNTHLDSDRSDVRLAQVTALLEAWAGRPRTVLVGDMNALPGSEEIELILAAGFVDAWAETGQTEYPRIDWIFHTADLMAQDVLVIESPASDHPAFAATIMLRP